MDDVKQYLDFVKPKIRIKTEAYDEKDLIPLIEAALADMRRVGIVVPNTSTGDPPDPLCLQAVVLYCRGHFGSSATAELFRDSYEGLRDSMSLSSVYTTSNTEGGESG